MIAAPVRWRAIGSGRSTTLALLPALLLFIGPLTVLLASGETPRADVQTAALVVAVLPLITPLLLRVVGQRWDPLLLSPAWMLCALSLMVIARVQPDLLAAQMLWITLGWSVFIAMAGFPPLLRWLQRYRYVWLAAALLMTVATLVLGEDVTGQGARLWLQVGPVTIQPAEVLRVTLIVVLAAYLAERAPDLARTWRQLGPLHLPAPVYWLPLAAILGLTLMVVVAQRDFGPSLIFVSSFMGMLYVAVGRKSQLVALGLLFAAAGAAAVLASTRLQLRMQTWLEPWDDPQGLGYQSLQALGGLVSGGVTGTGPGYGFPGLIPAAHTDYPLAVVGEEWGLLGALAVIMLYALLVTRGIARARGTGHNFAQLLSAGLALSLGAQALIVLAGVLRVLPLTGITSPFLSYGGSSMISAWIILALMLRAGGDERTAGTSAEPVYLSAMIQRMRHVGVGLLAGFVVLSGMLGYWQVVRAAELASDPAVSGQRLRLEAARITRGSLLDRNGEVLAQTVIGPDGTPRREYMEPSAVHLVGFDSPLLGAAGAEAAAADALMGRTQLTPWDTFRDLLNDPRSGADVHLTIDARLQRVAAEAMGGASGAAIAIDPRTGDILAMVSNPTYPANFSEEEWEALLADERSPLLNRATQGLYTPGSTFKTVTLIAAVENGLVTADTPVTCEEEIFVEGIRIVSRNEPDGPGTQNIGDAFAYSCNTVFAELGLEIGDDALIAIAASLGLAEAVPLPLPTSAGQLANSRAFLASDGGLAATAFGQGELQLTPLHLALMTAAVGNNGQVPRPRIFLDDASGTWHTAMSPQTAREVALIMEQGVASGWGATAAIPGVRVGGKTGSAEVEEGIAPHALFVAFAPVDEPTIAVAVVKELAGSGSREAGPVARAIIEAWVTGG